MKLQLKRLSGYIVVLLLIIIMLQSENEHRVISTCSIQSDNLYNPNQCRERERNDERLIQRLTFALNISFDQIDRSKTSFVAFENQLQKRLPIIQINVSATDLGSHKALIVVGQKRLRFSWEPAVALEENQTSNLKIEILGKRQLRAWVNGDQVYGFRWDVPITGDFDISTTKIIQTVPSTHLEASMSAAFEQSRKRFVSNEVLAAFIILLSTLLLLLFNGLSLRGLKPNSTNTALFIHIIQFAVVVTCITLIVGRFGFFGTDVYFDRNGVTYSRFPRFSDWHQLRDLSQFKEPYLVGISQYPPAFLGVFKAAPFVSSERGLVIMATLCPLAIAYLLSFFFNRRDVLTYIFFAVSISLSYPYLYALDRGSSELFVVMFFALFVWSYIQERILLACIILGIIISLKAFPIIFLPLLVRKIRDIKYIVFSIGVAGILTVVGSVILSGSPITSIFQFLELTITSNSVISQASQLSERSTSIFQWAHSFPKLLSSKTMSEEDSNAITIAVNILSLSIVCTSAFFFLSKRMSNVNKLMMLTLVMLMIVPLSYDYRLMWLLPVLGPWTIGRATKGLRYLYIPLVGCLISARPIFFGREAMTLGSLLTFPLLFLMFIVLLVEEMQEVVTADDLMRDNPN